METLSNINNSTAPFSDNTVQAEKPEMNFNIEAHTTSNMKLDRPKVTNSISPPLMQTKHIFKPSDADRYLKNLNTDIYESTQKEKTNHEFNFKRFFTIFGVIALITGAITYFCRRK